MNDHGNTSCLYRILGVPRDATQAEIKAAFRQLAQETHPDVAGANSNKARFQRIAHAASVLGNARNRQEYDHQRNLFATAYGAAQPHGNSAFHHSNRPPRSHKQQQQPKSGFTGVLLTMFRPRNMVLGPLAVWATVSAIQYALGIDSDSKRKHHRDDDDRVQAWLNPTSNQWETPAPWDPHYQRLQPTLERVPRRQVQTRHR